MSHDSLPDGVEIGPDGQFISVEDGPSHRYHDYEFQHLRSTYRIEAADLPAAFPVEETDARVHEMDDLLHRDERADLVSVSVHSLQMTVPGTQTAEGSVEVAWELSTGPGSRLITSEDSTSNLDVGSDNIDEQFWSSDDPGVLYHAGWIAEGSFSDTGNSVAGGADAPVLDQDSHFPRDYDACPRYDDRDEITESFRIRNPGDTPVEDSLIKLEVAYSLVFLVHEADRC